MLQLDARASGGFGSETNLDLARLGTIGFDLPAWADVPTEHDAMRGLVREHASPAADGAVHASVVHISARTRLEHALGDGHGEQVVFGRKPAADSLGEDRERARNRRVDHHLCAY